VPSGSTLHVRPGRYGHFSITNKSLTIIGTQFPRVQNRGTAFPPHGTTIAINAGQSVILSGLHFVNEFDHSTNPRDSRIFVDGCAGPVVLEDIKLEEDLNLPGRYFRLDVRNSQNVHVSRLNVGLQFFRPPCCSPPGPPIVVENSSVSFSRLRVEGYRLAGANEGLRIAQQSTVVLVDPSITGGSGGGSMAGGAGVTLSGGSTLHVYGNANTAPSSVAGGPGSSFSGGNGLELRGGSFARVRGVTLSGGSGTPPGQPSFVEAGSTLEYAPADVAPSAFLAGTVQPGNTVRYTLHAKPGSVALLMVGNPALFATVPLTLGVLEVNPQIQVMAGVVPATQRLEVPSLVPNNWPNNFVLLAQFATFHPSPAELSVTNLFTVTSRF
jgi:hypothetical protein